MSVVAQDQSTEVVKSSKVPEMYIETLVKGASGYVRDDTVGTPFEEVINCAGIEFIPNTGYMSEEILDSDGKGTGRYKNTAIRYIKNCPLIKVNEQKAADWEKSKISTSDSIQITKGKSIIKREGDIALYDYLKNVFWNAQAPNRPRSAKALFTVVELEKNVSDLNEKDFLEAKAVMLVEGLVLKTGKTHKFKENKIDNLLTAINTFGGDNYADKIRVLTSKAKEDPKSFLDIATKMEGVVVTEISHAMQLAVIQFVGNTLQYIGDKKIVVVVSEEYKSQSKKIEAAAELLKTPEYAQAYQELKAKLEIAEENQLKA